MFDVCKRKSTDCLQFYKILKVQRNKVDDMDANADDDGTHSELGISFYMAHI